MRPRRSAYWRGSSPATHGGRHYPAVCELAAMVASPGEHCRGRDDREHDRARRRLESTIPVLPPLTLHGDGRRVLDLYPRRMWPESIDRVLLAARQSSAGEFTLQIADGSPQILLAFAQCSG